MSLDLKTVERIAQLAKLEFNEKEKEEILSDMNKILEFINKLEEIDTENVEPLIYMLEEKADLRADEVKQTISQEEALKNAPNKDSDFIKVPKVIS